MTRMQAAALAVVLLAAGPAPSVAQAPGGPPLAPDHWSYELLQALDAAGVADAWMTDVRPSGRGTVRGELERVVRGGFAGVGPTGDLARSWLARFEGRNPLGPDRRDGASWELRARAGVRDGRALLDPGSGARALAGGAARLGPASFWLEAGEPGRERFGEAVVSTGVSLPLGPFQAMAGRMAVKAAGPASTSVQLAGHLPADVLYLASRERVPVPGLAWLFGPVAWQLGLVPFDGAGEWERGWIGLGGAIARPSPDLRIGAVRTARFGGEQVPGTTLPRLLRTVFLVQNEPSSWDDQKNELTLRYRWTLAGQPVSAHLALGMEDAPYWRDPAVLSGVTVPFVRDEGLWVLRYEYHAFGARARWCPVCRFDRLTPGGAFDRAPWYHHSAHPVYERRGLPLGAPLGGYGASHTARLRFWDAGARFRLEGWAFFQVREEGNLLHDRWPGKRRGSRSRPGRRRPTGPGSPGSGGSRRRWAGWPGAGARPPGRVGVPGPRARRPGAGS